mmetsp:Transcript_21748/g.32369  ORF Transcript_21748/g.32369 Transcript_21748/m.32369 type:complete len:111 (+) Transcript_21748:49-381(+)
MDFSSFLDEAFKNVEENIRLSERKEKILKIAPVEERKSPQADLGESDIKGTKEGEEFSSYQGDIESWKKNMAQHNELFKGISKQIQKFAEQKVPIADPNNSMSMPQSGHR